MKYASQNLIPFAIGIHEFQKLSMNDTVNMYIYVSAALPYHVCQQERGCCFVLFSFKNRKEKKLVFYTPKGIRYGVTGRSVYATVIFRKLPGLYEILAACYN